MNEDFASRVWAESQRQFAEDVARGLKTLWRGFERLNAAQFEAPWQARRARHAGAKARTCSAN